MSLMLHVMPINFCYTARLSVAVWLILSVSLCCNEEAINGAIYRAQHICFWELWPDSISAGKDSNSLSRKVQVLNQIIFVFSKTQRLYRIKNNSCYASPSCSPAVGRVRFSVLRWVKSGVVILHSWRSIKLSVDCIGSFSRERCVLVIYRVLYGLGVFTSTFDEK